MISCLLHDNMQTPALTSLTEVWPEVEHAWEFAILRVRLTIKQSKSTEENPQKNLNLVSSLTLVSQSQYNSRKYRKYSQTFWCCALWKDWIKCPLALCELTDNSVFVHTLSSFALMNQSRLLILFLKAVT